MNDPLDKLSAGSGEKWTMESVVKIWQDKGFEGVADAHNSALEQAIAESEKHAKFTTKIANERLEEIARLKLQSVGSGDKWTELIAAAQELHDDIAEYARINNLGGFDNHAMKRIRKAIADAHNAALAPRIK